MDGLHRAAVLIRFCDGMGDQQHCDAAHYADGLPALFVVLDPVLDGQAKRIMEDLRGLLKGNPVMLLLVEAVLSSRQVNLKSVIAPM